MQVIAKTQHETWQAYEATDHGFDQVKNLFAELNNILNNVGSLTVGQGRSYMAGSFALTLRTLSGLTGGMLDYCRENQQAASDGWDSLFSGYVEDVEAEQERQRKEDALWGVLWDGIQVVEGVLIVAVGVVGTPFSAGATLAFAGLGGSLIVGGVNSAIDHASIASTGEGLNLVGMASDQVGHWYDVTVMQPAAGSGSWAGQFVASVGSGVGQVMSGAAQMNLRDTGRGIEALVFDEDVRHQALQQVTTLVDQVREGNPVVIGQLVGNALPGAAALKIAKASGLVGRADKFADFGKPIITNPSRTTSALDWLKNQIGAGGVTVSDVFEPSILPRIDLRKAEVRRLNNADLRGDPRFETALEDRNSAQTKLDQATTARNQALTELRELGIDIDPKTPKKKDIVGVIDSHREEVSVADLSDTDKDARLDLLDELEERSFEERKSWTARNNSSRDLGEKAAAAYREALGDTEVLNRPNAVRDRFDLITQSPDRTRLTFTEAKGGDAKLSSTGRRVDGESAAQGSTTYFNDLFQKDPEFRAWLDENPGVLEKLQKGEIKIEYQMVRARPDGTVEVSDLVLDQSALELK